MTLRTPKGRIQRNAHVPEHKEVLQALIVLMDTNPLVWRRLEVPIDYSFWDLHVAIQDAMGWKDYHLHEFRCPQFARAGTKIIGIPDDNGFEKPAAPGWSIPIDIYAGIYKSMPFEYVYDFGDGWRHLVSFEDRYRVEEGATYPRCVAGARRCPPEDCGGTHGYLGFLEVIRDKTHPEHNEYLQWVGGKFNPDDFKPESIKFDDPDMRYRVAFEGEEYEAG